MTHWARQNLVGAWCPAIGGSDGFLLRDFSGNGNHGTMTNSAPSTDISFAERFRGWRNQGSDHVSIADCIRTLGENASYCTWFYNEANFTGIQTLIGTGVSTKQLTVYFWSTTSFYTGFKGTEVVTSISTTMAVNQWIHAVFVLSGSALTIFINGERSGSNASAVGSVWTPAETRISRDPAAIGNSFRGWQADVRIYRKSLVDAEVQQLYQGGPGYGLRAKRTRVYFGSVSTGNRRRRLICGAPT